MGERGRGRERSEEMRKLVVPSVKGGREGGEQGGREENRERERGEQGGREENRVGERRTGWKRGEQGGRGGKEDEIIGYHAGVHVHYNYTCSVVLLSSELVITFRRLQPISERGGHVAE